MKFWRGNRIDGEFDQPASEVADQFTAWYRSELASDRRNADIPLERTLRFWLADAGHFNCTWTDERGDESFDVLFEAVRARIFGRPERRDDYALPQ